MSKMSSLSCFKGIPKSQIIIVVAVALTIIIVVPVVGYLNTVAVEEKSRSGSSGLINPDDAAAMANFSGIIMSAAVKYVDIGSFIYKMHLQIKWAGEYNQPPLNQSSQPVELQVNGKSIIIGRSQPAYPEELTMNFLTGKQNDYPFDIYTDNVQIFARRPENNTVIVPVAFKYSGSLQGWTIENLVSEDRSIINLRLSFRRSPTTKFFSIAVMIGMWALSLSIITLASRIWAHGRKVEPPLIAIGAGLLFALPAMRNIQPAIPVIGCTADAVSFFWSMALTAAALLLLIWNYIVMNEREQVKKRQDQEATLSESTAVEYKRDFQLYSSPNMSKLSQAHTRQQY